MGDACCGHDTAHDPNVHRDDAPGGAGRDDGEAQQLWEIREVRLAAISGVLLAMALGAGAAGVGGASEWFLAAALVVGGATFVPDTLRALARGRLGVGTLMTVAAVGAVALGELGEAASLAFLFSISEALEGYALARTRRGLRALLALVPPRVTVRRGDGTAQVHPDDLVIGDVMVIAPGERVATDGTVVGGR